MYIPSVDPKGFFCRSVLPNKFFCKKMIKNANWVLKPGAKYSIIRPMQSGYLPFARKSGERKFQKETIC